MFGKITFHTGWIISLLFTLLLTGCNGGSNSSSGASPNSTNSNGTPTSAAAGWVTSDQTINLGDGNSIVGVLVKNPTTNIISAVVAKSTTGSSSSSSTTIPLSPGATGLVMYRHITSSGKWQFSSAFRVNNSGMGVVDYGTNGLPTLVRYPNGFTVHFSTWDLSGGTVDITVANGAGVIVIPQHKIHIPIKSIPFLQSVVKNFSAKLGGTTSAGVVAGAFLGLSSYSWVKIGALALGGAGCAVATAAAVGTGGIATPLAALSCTAFVDQSIVAVAPSNTTIQAGSMAISDVAALSDLNPFSLAGSVLDDYAEGVLKVGPPTIQVKKITLVQTNKIKIPFYPGRNAQRTIFIYGDKCALQSITAGLSQSGKNQSQCNNYEEVTVQSPQNYAILSGVKRKVYYQAFSTNGNGPGDRSALTPMAYVEINAAPSITLNRSKLRLYPNQTVSFSAKATGIDKNLTWTTTGGTITPADSTSEQVVTYKASSAPGNYFLTAYISLNSSVKQTIPVQILPVQKITSEIVVPITPPPMIQRTSNTSSGSTTWGTLTASGFATTTATYSTKGGATEASLNAGCSSQFGSQFRLADWSDVIGAIKIGYYGILPQQGLSAIVSRQGSIYTSSQFNTVAQAGAISASFVLQPSGSHHALCVKQPAPWAPPVMSGVTNQTIAASSKGSETFTVTGTVPFSVSATSSNSTLLPNSDITANCSSTGSCTLSLNPISGQTGTAIVTALVTDGTGQSSSQTFTLTVNPPSGTTSNPPSSTSTGSSPTPTFIESIPIGGNLVALAISPNGNDVYVVNADDNTVSVIDTTTNTVVSTISPAEGYGRGFAALAISPNGEYVYVADGFSDAVLVIATATDTVVGKPISVGVNPSALAISLNGQYVYVANADDNTVSVIDTATNTVVGKPISVGANPSALAISLNGQYVYVANNGSGTVSVIDTATDTVVGNTPVGNYPSALAINPNGNDVYVGHNYDGSSSTVSVIDTATNTVVGNIPVGNGPGALAIGPSGQYVYVANNGDGTVSVIDTATNTVIGKPINVDPGPSALAITPNENDVYVSNINFSGTVSVIDTGIHSTSGSGSRLIAAGVYYGLGTNQAGLIPVFGAILPNNQGSYFTSTAGIPGVFQLKGLLTSGAFSGSGVLKGLLTSGAFSGSGVGYAPTGSATSPYQVVTLSYKGVGDASGSVVSRLFAHISGPRTLPATVTLNYQVISSTPLALTQLTGNFSGYKTSNIRHSISGQISSNGSFTASDVTGCTLSGQITPVSGYDLAKVTLSSIGVSTCAGSDLTGVGWYTTRDLNNTYKGATGHYFYIVATNKGQNTFAAELSLP